MHALVCRLSETDNEEKTQNRKYEQYEDGKRSNNNKMHTILFSIFTVSGYTRNFYFSLNFFNDFRTFVPFPSLSQCKHQCFCFGFCCCSFFFELSLNFARKTTKLIESILSHFFLSSFYFQS